MNASHENRWATEEQDATSAKIVYLRPHPPAPACIQPRVVREKAQDSAKKTAVDDFVAMIKAAQQQRDEARAELGQQVLELRRAASEKQQLLTLLARSQQQASDVQLWAVQNEQIAEQRIQELQGALELSTVRLELALQLAEELLEGRWMRKRSRARYQRRIMALSGR